MFIPGPRRESILFRRSSLPVISYKSLTSSVLKVHPSAVPFGREKAFVPQSMRIPEGPSAQQPTGIPSAFMDSVTPPNAAAVPGVTLGLHIPSPRNIAIRSSSLICAIKFSIDTLPSSTSTSLYPLSPV